MTEAGGFPYLPLKWLFDIALGHVTWRAISAVLCGFLQVQNKVSLLTQGVCMSSFYSTAWFSPGTKGLLCCSFPGRKIFLLHLLILLLFVGRIQGKCHAQ